MDLQAFALSLRERIPTASEFLAVVESFGWAVCRREDQTPVLRARGGGTLARSLAKLLSREPYRTQVLQLAFPDEAQEAAGAPRQWLWRDGHTYTETPGDLWLWGHKDRHPVGAWWWRRQGNAGWKIIEERARASTVGLESLLRGEALPPGEKLDGSLPGSRGQGRESQRGDRS